jgi:VRR-NUC domain-containing protein
MKLLVVTLLWIKLLPEKIIENQILSFLRSKRIYCWKQPNGGFFDTRIGKFRKQQSPFAIQGVADILGLLPNGRFLAIECKSEKGKVSPHQELFISQINANGGCAFVAHSLEEAKKGLEGLI